MLRRFLVLLFLTSYVIWAQDIIDENALFGNPDAVVVDSAEFRNPSSTVQQIDEKNPLSERGIKSSGTVATSATLGYTRSSISSLTDGTPTAPTLQNVSVGTLFLDARAEDDTKAFAAIEGQYRSDSSLTHVYLRELFVDFNLRKHIYLRAGKQVLQWGRCYFWNPSDLINIEKKAFVERQGSLDGTFGLRTHIPIGTTANFYAFIDTKDAKYADQVKGTAKAELLLGSTETAISIWGRKGLDPVYAWDISSAIHRWNIASELALFPQGFSTRYVTRNDSLITTPNKAFAPRAVVSFGRSFDVLSVQDRLQLQYELYFNGLGYAQSPLSDSQSYTWDSSKILTPEQTGFSSTMTMNQGPKALWLYANNQISSFSLGRYYAAFFASFSRIFIPDLTLSCNGLMNVTDRSYMFSTSLGYTTLSNLTLQTTLLSLGGPAPAEFTYTQQRITLMGTLQYSF
jgi:hypothetical protein